jgi:hypothetical protein
VIDNRNEPPGLDEPDEPQEQTIPRDPPSRRVGRSTTGPDKDALTGPAIPFRPEPVDR